MGKGYFVKELKTICPTCLAEISRENAVIINPDLIRPLLPEYDLYTDPNPQTKENQITKLSEEVGLIGEIIMWATLKTTNYKRNVLFDSSMRHRKWFVNLFDLVQKRPEGKAFRTAIIGVEPKSEKSYKDQIEKRNNESTRKTQVDFAMKAQADVKQTLVELEHKVNRAVIVQNPGIQSSIEDFALVIFCKERGEKPLVLSVRELEKKADDLLHLCETLLPPAKLS